MMLDCRISQLQETQMFLVYLLYQKKYLLSCEFSHNASQSTPFLPASTENKGGYTLVLNTKGVLFKSRTPFVLLIINDSYSSPF